MTSIELKNLLASLKTYKNSPAVAGDPDRRLYKKVDDVMKAAEGEMSFMEQMEPQVKRLMAARAKMNLELKAKISASVKAAFAKPEVKAKLRSSRVTRSPA